MTVILFSNLSSTKSTQTNHKFVIYTQNNTKLSIFTSKFENLKKSANMLIYVSSLANNKGLKQKTNSFAHLYAPNYPRIPIFSSLASSSSDEFFTQASVTHRQTDTRTHGHFSDFLAPRPIFSFFENRNFHFDFSFDFLFSLYFPLLF